MKILVIYHSKTGFTRRYAQWLQEDISCDIVPYDRRNTVELSRYDAVVYGAGCHAGSIRKLGWFLDKLPELSGKRLAVFFTGATPAGAPLVEEAIKKNFTPEQLEKMGVFYLWSGLNYEDMGPLDKFMMTMLKRMLHAKADATQEEKEMAKVISSSFDKTDRAYLRPLEEYLLAE